MQPVIIYQVFYNGARDELERYMAPLREIGPISIEGGVTTYDKLSQVAGFDLDGRVCQQQGMVSLYPIDVPKYDVPAVRAWYNTFRDMLQAEPVLGGSFCLLEQYPIQAVQAVPEESTAFAHRSQKLLL